MMDIDYSAMWLNITATKARKLLKGHAVFITPEDFEGDYERNTRGFIVQNHHCEYLDNVRYHGAIYSMRLNNEEIEGNTQHRFHKIKIGKNFFM